MDNTARKPKVGDMVTTGPIQVGTRVIVDGVHEGTVLCVVNARGNRLMAWVFCDDAKQPVTEWISDLTRVEDKP